MLLLLLLMAGDLLEVAVAGDLGCDLDLAAAAARLGLPVPNSYGSEVLLLVDRHELALNLESRQSRLKQTMSSTESDTS